MDFTNFAGVETGGELIPDGQLAFATIELQDQKVSANTGSVYYPVKLTIDDGQPYANRKVFSILMDPQASENSEDAKKMASAQIARILEVGNNAGPEAPQNYNIPHLEYLTGMRCAIKIGIDTSGRKNGYDDKNSVKDFLTPNPQSKASKNYNLLAQGTYNVKEGQQQQAPASNFSQPAAEQPSPEATGAATSPSNAGVQQPNWLSQ